MNLLHLVILTAQIGAVTALALGAFSAWVWMNRLMWVPQRAARVPSAAGGYAGPLQ